MLRPCPRPGSRAQARPDKVKHGVGSAPALQPGPASGHESAPGGIGQPRLDHWLVAGKAWGWGGGAFLGRAGTGQEESPAGEGQALTSFSALRIPTSSSAQKAPPEAP